MATAEEIERRVEQVDTPRSATRTAAAQQVSALAVRRTAIAQQLADIEGQLGDVLAAAMEVMTIEELATFTDVPAADLTRWHTTRKPNRTKRKRPTAGAESDRPSTSRTPTGRPIATPPAPARTDDIDPSTRVPADVA